MPHVHPEADALQQLQAQCPEGPVVMLNMLRFREHAEYPAGSEHAPCTGREAYRRYGEIALQHVLAVGGKPVWMGVAKHVVIGPREEAWDEVLLVEYPSSAAFLKMATDPGYLASVVHRTAALEDSRLIAMQGTMP